MRSFLLSAALGLAILGLFLGPAASSAEAFGGRWWSSYYYPTYSYYGSGYYSPYYYPYYGYYPPTTSYYYAPGYSNYYTPGYTYYSTITLRDTPPITTPRGITRGTTTFTDEMSCLWRRLPVHERSCGSLS
jgi:hypothetical protein